MKIEKSVNLIRIFLGVNFFWFGMLKFFPGVSPAETLAALTIQKLTLGLILPPLSVKLLAIWEVLIGIGFLSGRFIPFFVRIFMLHMVLTFTPLFLFPDICFTEPPFTLTIVGQYIIKNIVFIASGIAVCIVHKEKQL
ncbi:DoxX family protein [Sulfuricurvum kujiense DSM 16994]|uniref:DoxX family protein n=1 Tax=Sulfuricurvum kujiense (strain ATCC BAA-921 / DSM 16994 / JCM 11577 / YK-1) TaxID=709032 RepID=E4U1B5_SULKY|nr:DoxX family membrane protein [Sulfuricurvum kujiense]ADR34452.1 DoxX family protein [Sulfuricurvum kujiense DSM 16994]